MMPDPSPRSIRTRLTAGSAADMAGALRIVRERFPDDPAGYLAAVDRDYGIPPAYAVALLSRRDPDTVLCADPHHHATAHRWTGSGWTCDRCEETAAMTEATPDRDRQARIELERGRLAAIDARIADLERRAEIAKAESVLRPTVEAAEILAGILAGLELVGSERAIQAGAVALLEHDAADAAAAAAVAAWRQTREAEQRAAIERSSRP